MPRDVSLSDSKCWNGGHEWVKMTRDDPKFRFGSKTMNGFFREGLWGY